MPMLHDQPGRAAEILRTVAHPLRLRILSLLCAGEERVGALAARLDASQSSVSQALAILRQERLVAVTRGHRQARYRVEEPALRELVRWIERTLAADATPGAAGEAPSRAPSRRPGPPRPGCQPARA